MLLNNPFRLRNCFDVIHDCRKGKTALLCASSDAENPDVIAALLLNSLGWLEGLSDRGEGSDECKYDGRATWKRGKRVLSERSAKASR